jgi:replicative superfamily II helicase
MVDFNKRLANKTVTKPLDPCELYETLDRASDKGPLRPAQIAVLTEWHTLRRAGRDLIVKLHTGQGKTLIGLLMLQSKLNETAEPVAYLCPNNFLIEQTKTQAEQFGIAVCTAEHDLPQDFFDGRTILITSVQKMFNGLSKFGIGARAVQLGTVLMDDCHACIDSIRDAFVIKLQKDEPAFQQIFDLFATSLEEQGFGTFIDVKTGNPDTFLPVPYWAWSERRDEVTRILGKHVSKDAVKFAWPLIKDHLEHCECVLSGTMLEIAPRLPALDLFGSYHRAKHRFFMSATVTDDSFLIKGLRLPAETIRNPLLYKQETWSGEKMILIPSMLSEELGRREIISALGGPIEGKKFGTVVLTPSFRQSEKWKEEGARVAKRDTIAAEVKRLRDGKCDETVVFVNRYDGIDLPDTTCRILIFDSKPHSDSLIERFYEWCRPSSELTSVRTVRTIEQGLGRSVRGEKDYSVIIITGPELVKTIRSASMREYFSNQTKQQIAIGLEIAAMAEEDISKRTKALTVMFDLITQCLKRDEGWKLFYAEKMNNIVPKPARAKALDIFKSELEAETKFQSGEPDKAVKILQSLIDGTDTNVEDKNWYLQEIARYTCAFDPEASNKLQIKAHFRNKFLLRPKKGMQVQPLVVIGQKRITNLIKWIKQYNSFPDLQVGTEDILGSLEFGVTAEKFEAALDELGKHLGFACERPDKEWKRGPDNLWGLEAGKYLLFECKSEVLNDRTHINKSESGQMNNSCAWFKDEYESATAAKIIIIPTNALGPGAGFNDEVNVMSAGELKKLKKNVRAFFNEFRTQNFDDLDESAVQSWLDAHNLSTDALENQYSRAPVST